MCFVEHVEIKSVFNFQPKKRLVFATVKSAKPAGTNWMFLSRTKTDNYVFCGNGTHCCVKKMSRDYEKQNHLNFWRTTEPKAE